jgi:trigger factor
MMPAEFDAALLGVTPGGQAVAEFDIPDTSSNEEFVGKAARFEIDVHEVKSKVLPALDDEFAASAGGFDSMADYRADVREKLDAAKAAGHMHEVENAAIAVLAERLEGEVPSEMVESRAASMLREFIESVESRGISLQEYMQMTGASPEQVQDDLTEQAGRRVREELALEALFRAQGLEITETDMDDAVRQIAGGDEAESDKLRENLATNGALPIVREQIMHRKALKWLIDAVVVDEEEQS